MYWLITIQFPGENVCFSLGPIAIMYPLKAFFTGNAVEYDETL